MIYDFRLMIYRWRLMICTLAIATFLFSCGNDESATSKKDSTSDSTTVITTGTHEVETDSGRLVITHVEGSEADDVVLLDASGKLLARGHMFQNKVTGAWLNYDANGNVVSAVQYSNGSVKYQLDANDFKTKRVGYKEMGISFAIPVNWDTISPFNPKTLISYEKEISEPGVAMKPNINISKGTLDAGQTLDVLAKQDLDMLHEAVGRVEIVDEAYLSIDSCKAFRRYGMYYTEDNKVGFLDAIIIHGNDVYVISCAAQNREQGEFLKYQAVFENLVMSVQIDQ